MKMVNTRTLARTHWYRLPETYSKGFAAAGMLGYLMDGRSQDAVAGLRTKIEEKR